MDYFLKNTSIFFLQAPKFPISKLHQITQLSISTCVSLLLLYLQNLTLHKNSKLSIQPPTPINPNLTILFFSKNQAFLLTRNFVFRVQRNGKKRDGRFVSGSSTFFPSPCPPPPFPVLSVSRPRNVFVPLLNVAQR